MSEIQTIKTEVGSVFISNYPPFSQWTPDALPAVLDALNSPPLPNHDPNAADLARPLGLYLHIPFCRKRCKFCYFRVYTEKNATKLKITLPVFRVKLNWSAA